MLSTWCPSPMVHVQYEPHTQTKIITIVHPMILSEMQAESQTLVSIHYQAASSPSLSLSSLSRLMESSCRHPQDCAAAAYLLLIPLMQCKSTAQYLSVLSMPDVSFWRWNSPRVWFRITLLKWAVFFLLLPETISTLLLTEETLSGSTAGEKRCYLG